MKDETEACPCPGCPTPAHRCASAPAGESPSTGQAGGTDGELRELNVVLDWYPNALHAFLYDAIEKGYYAEEGLQVNIQFPSNTNDAISLVAAGQAEIGLYYQQDVIIARANQDVPVKSIGAVVQGPLNIVLSLAEKDIRSPEDLVGKTIGYAGTELSEALIRSMMAYVGADSSDVEMIDVGFDLMSSMTTGNVDATIGCLVEPRGAPDGGGGLCRQLVRSGRLRRAHLLRGGVPGRRRDDQERAGGAGCLPAGLRQGF